MTITTALQRIERLIPTYLSPILKGEGVWVLTSPAELPEEFRQAQEERTRHYMTTDDRATARTAPGHAPRYIVTSYTVPIAWVTVDGRTHYAEGAAMGEGRTSARWRAIRRHQDAVRAVWPERFGINADGDASCSVPGGFRLDDDGELHEIG
jgi:hypothetical protein